MPHAAFDHNLGLSLQGSLGLASVPSGLSHLWCGQLGKDRCVGDGGDVARPTKKKFAVPISSSDGRRARSWTEAFWALLTGLSPVVHHVFSWIWWIVEYLWMGLLNHSKQFKADYYRISYDYCQPRINKPCSILCGASPSSNSHWLLNLLKWHPPH